MIARRGVSRRVRFGVDDRHGDAGQHRAGRVGDAAGDRPACVLGAGDGRAGKGRQTGQQQGPAYTPEARGHGLGRAHQSLHEAKADTIPGVHIQVSAKGYCPEGWCQIKYMICRRYWRLALRRVTQHGPQLRILARSAPAGVSPDRGCDGVRDAPACRARWGPSRAGRREGCRRPPAPRAWAAA